jgi:hypothetical protein|tara:strand:+ start:437 stop:760 length:324 start_codon:yes stop_codon:yes gene_type:complete
MKTEIGNVDLFEHLETLPDEVQEIVLAFSEGDNDYEACKALEVSLKPLGFTFDWGLDAEPYDLREIPQSERNGNASEGKVALEELDLSRLDGLCSTIPNRVSPSHGR